MLNKVILLLYLLGYLLNDVLFTHYFQFIELDEVFPGEKIQPSA